jgi:acetoin utilization deacetylase AcuC-like enzyme
MMLSSKDYAYMTDALLAIADTYCQGRVVMTHEGGYSAAYVPYCGLAVLERISGHDTGVEDPFLGFIQNYGGQKLLPHQQAAINEVAENHKQTEP